jgi:prepilin-type processing-associated H-X9-DG protein
MAMSVAVGDPEWRRLVEQQTATPRFKLFFKTADYSVGSPSKIHVFVDEHPDSINNGTFGVWMSDLSNPAKAYIFYFPASYHNGACGFSFADGHAEIHKWVDGRTKLKPVYKNVLTLG